MGSIAKPSWFPIIPKWLMFQNGNKIRNFGLPPPAFDPSGFPSPITWADAVTPQCWNACRWPRLPGSVFTGSPSDHLAKIAKGPKLTHNLLGKFLRLMIYDDIHYLKNGELSSMISSPAVQIQISRDRAEIFRQTAPWSFPNVKESKRMPWIPTPGAAVASIESLRENLGCAKPDPYENYSYD